MEMASPPADRVLLLGPLQVIQNGAPLHQPLQPACLGIEVGKVHEVILQGLPVRWGVQQHALVAVDRRHDRPFPGLGEGVPNASGE